MEKMKLRSDIHIYIIYIGETATGECQLDPGDWRLDPGTWRLFGCNPGDPI